jgi:predicted AlkP superfamily phosphohydrolase/phosphomutase
LEEIYRQIEVEIRITYLLEAKHDFFMGVSWTDVVQHLFWRHMDRPPHFHPDGRRNRVPAS